MKRTGQKADILAIMERGEEAHKKSRLRRLQTYQRKLLPAALALLLGIPLGGFIKMNVSADERIAPAQKPYYTSIQVEEGDSLWSIASRYAPESHMDVREYVDALKSINRLTNDTIHTGHYLMIVHYR